MFKALPAVLVSTVSILVLVGCASPTTPDSTPPPADSVSMSAASAEAAYKSYFDGNAQFGEIDRNKLLDTGNSVCASIDEGKVPKDIIASIGSELALDSAASLTVFQAAKNSLCRVG